MGRNNPFHDALQVQILLGVVASLCTPLPAWTQWFQTLLTQQCWELLHPFAYHCQHGRNNSNYCWPNNVGSCCIPLHTTASMDTIIPNITDPTMLGVVASLCTPLPAWTQQFQTLPTQQCWELLLQFAVSLTFICNIINPIPGKLSPGWTMQTSAKIVAHYLTL